MNNVLFSCPVVSNSLWPHGLQQARPPCPSFFFSKWDYVMNDIYAQIPWDLHDHFCAYFSFSVLYFQKLVSAWDFFFFFLFRDECLQVAVACFVDTAENRLKMCLRPPPLIKFMGEASGWKNTWGLIFSQEFSGIRLKWPSLQFCLG